MKKTIEKVIRSLIPDALAIAGVFLIWRGVDLIHRPAGLIVLGLLAVAGAVIVAKAGIVAKVGDGE